MTTAKNTIDPRVLSTTSLSHTDVQTPEGQHIGYIKDLMVDLPTGQVAYAVLAVGGFLGLGEKLFALPWTALAVDPKRRCILLDVDREWFTNAPGFDKHNWPKTADRRFIHDLYRHNGYVVHDEADTVESPLHP